MKIDNRNALRKALILGLLFIMVFEVMIYGFTSYNKETRINNLYPKYEAVESQIDNVFQSTFTISDGYLSFITSNLNSTKEESETFLGYLLSYDENYIKNIAAIEDTTIKFNYPYEENQSSIGVDLATVETQRDDILRVKNNLETLFIGPVDLVQGGSGFILRIPILDGDTYWGQIAVVINVDLFEQVLIDEADMNQVNFNIYDNISNRYIFEYGDDPSENESISNTYTNQYISWTLTVSNTTESSFWLIGLISRIVGSSLILMLCVLIYKDKVLDNQIKYFAIHDSLTGDYNRAKFITDYNAGLFNGMLIAFTDVNKFKLLNDTLGHSFGDWCLIQISNKLRSLNHFRTYRISGDEFILVSSAPMQIKEFQAELSSSKFTFYSDEFQQNVDIEIAIGILEKLDDSINLESMLMYLDYAMYDAKIENKALTVVDQELMKSYDHIKVIEQQLIEDIKMNNLIPYYQPIINLETKKIEGFEVLSRWIYKGKIQPAAMFIPVVKKIKYVDLVDINLFSKLQMEYQDLLEQCSAIKDISFSINLSAETLMIFERNNENFDKFVENRIMPIDKIVFEVSEDMNLGLISIETLRYIQNEGYAISIDDFGAGVSKLSDVLSGELKTIKTDRSLLPLQNTNDKKVNAFNTIIKAIEASETTICVEGVETLVQLNMAINAGCKLAQGYFFCKPIPKEQVINFVKNFNYDDYVK